MQKFTVAFEQDGRYKEEAFYSKSDALDFIRIIEKMENITDIQRLEKLPDGDVIDW